MAYADDVVLLAPTARAMRLMLHICDQYAQKYDMVFNASKSKCLVVSHRKLVKSVKPAFYIGGYEIEYVDSWPHLGNLVHVSGNDKHDIGNKKNALCGQINNVLCYFARRDPITKLRLMRIYCGSLYGSVLWDLTNVCVEDVCTVWRKGLRRVWNIPRHTRSHLLAPLCGTLPLREELSWRFINFTHSCLTSNSESVRFVACHGVFYRRMLSPIGRNAQYCCSRYNVRLAGFASIDKSVIWRYSRAAVSDDVWQRVSFILELLFIRCRFYSMDLLTQTELDSLIDFMCTY